MHKQKLTPCIAVFGDAIAELLQAGFRPVHDIRPRIISNYYLLRTDKAGQRKLFYYGKKLQKYFDNKVKS
ncbi:hypothetical protein AALA54_07675 [Oscillospiraceae bacterium 44-34]|jgi:hypothetical protein